MLYEEIGELRLKDRREMELMEGMRRMITMKRAFFAVKPKEANERKKKNLVFKDQFRFFSIIWKIKMDRKIGNGGGGIGGMG